MTDQLGATGPTLTLYSQNLLSKWGFNDGDTPEHLMDYWDDQGIDYSGIDWRQVLRRLVRDHLLPALTRHHRIEVYEIETIHNPIRASVVDGITIDAHEMNRGLTLNPESVDVPYPAIATACGL